MYNRQLELVLFVFVGKKIKQSLTCGSKLVTHLKAIEFGIGCKAKIGLLELVLKRWEGMLGKG